MSKKRVVIVGAGFAGMACARKLVSNDNLHITLIDKHNYHEFRPLLYQVATSALVPEDVASSLRAYFAGKENIDVKMTEVVSVDPKSRTVKTSSGQSYTADYLVLAAGSVANFFGTVGADQYSFPLYSLEDAERLRSRLIATWEAADRNPQRIAEGALNVVIVGGGPTGVEIAGAIADLIHDVLPNEYSDLQLKACKIYLVNYGKTVLAAFQEKSQEYAEKVLKNRGVELCLGIGVKEVAEDHVLLTDGSKILTRTVIWAGGLKAAPLSANCGLVQGHGGRINVQPDFCCAGFEGIYVLGDFANIGLPQLASVAQQSGYWTAKNIVHEMNGEPKVPFEYDDKGIMAMIGRKAAVAEIGQKRHELTGWIAFAAWLGVHAALLLTVRQKINAFIEWAWDYFGKSNSEQLLDRSNAARIQWEEVKK